MAVITPDSHGQELSEEMQDRILRLNTLSRIYELTNRVLTGDPVVVHIAPDGPAPAWSDGQSITFNATQIQETDLETLTQVTGLNYHELSHHMYTPRKGTDMVKWVIENGYFTGFNMLEDQRIETLLIGRYPSVVPFLQATILRWLANSPQDLEGNYMLVRGRRYLPVDIRERFRKEFLKPELIPTIIEIVDEYRLLAFPRDYKRAQELIDRWHKEVLQQWGDENGPCDLPQGPGGCTGRTPTSKGRPEPGKEQEQDAQNGGGIGQEESKFDPTQTKPNGGGEGTGTSGQGGDEKNKDDVESEGISPLIKQDKVNNGVEAPDSSQEAPSDTKKKPVVGSGHTPSAHQKMPKDLLDNIEKSIEDILDRRDVQKDIRTKQKVLNGGDGKHSESIRIGKYEEVTVSTEAVQHARRFGQELQQLKDDSEPSWQREVPSGRVNVQRVIRGCELDQAFDRWDEGNDSTDIEAVILVDRSGSMRSGGNDKLASVACWTIKRALNDIDALVSVYSFDDKAEVVYKRDEKPKRNAFKFIFGSGGTEPYDALTAAERIFKVSRKNNKILFVISDGIFDVDRNDEVIERLNRSGVLTALVLIADDSMVKNYKEMAEHYRVNYPNSDMAKRYELNHNAEIFTNIRTAGDLIPFARAVVSGAIKKRAGAR